MLNASAIDYKVPNATAYYERCDSVVRSPHVHLYYHYWDVSLCDNIGIEDERINRAGQALTDVWRARNPDIDTNCSCLHVDIFKNLINYYEPSPGFATFLPSLSSSRISFKYFFPFIRLETRSLNCPIWSTRVPYASFWIDKPV